MKCGSQPHLFMYKLSLLLPGCSSRVNWLQQSQKYTPSGLLLGKLVKPGSANKAIG